jgi:hypothetical protein
VVNTDRRELKIAGDPAYRRLATGHIRGKIVLLP